MKLLTIDGLGLVRRVYQANPEPDSAEKAEQSLRNCQLSFRKLLNTHEPSHALAVFDFGGHTWRHDILPDYRAGHDAMPQALHEALPAFYERLRETGLTVLAVPNVEPKDAIATVTLRWLKEERGEGVVASVDRDLHVLIAAGARLWDHFKNEWHDAAWVEKKYGIESKQMTDLVALMGDADDGIPGVEKIGIKTAARLLRSYGDVEGVMAGAGILLDPMGERLRRDRDAAFLSRRLAALKTDVQLGVTWNMLAWNFDQ
ncbi:MAG: 5'-3' exonuclease [Burkholderiaceae bacterium]|nr:5'-3' exonuclease [Burkholderiaceae bacterium]